MTRPVGRIEVWEPGGGAALYTIDDAQVIYYKEAITNAVGNFYFSAYSHKDFSGVYTYPNIDLGDTVKIWLDYDAIAGNPNFIGKVTKRSGPILTDTGWVRRIAGLSNGEVLLRRFKKNKIYQAIDASNIVIEWANDLSLGVGDITADTTDVNLDVDTKSYFDLLRWISDYWFDAGTQLKKDFWLNTSNNLVWKNRPLRTVGVETFTTANFLTDPLVDRDLEPVKNSITVYGYQGKIGVPGHEGKCEPSDKNVWTESTDGWTATYGDLTLCNTDFKVADNSLQVIAEDSGGFKAYLRRTVNLSTYGHAAYQTFNIFFRKWAGTVTSAKVSIGPDWSNRFEADLTVDPQWKWHSFQLGQNQEYEADTNPDGPWTKVGSPTWDNIVYLYLIVDGTDAFTVRFDRIFFGHGKFRYTASDLVGAGSSGVLYGQRDLETTDDKLLSDSDCEKRAQTLLYQLKDPPIQISFTVKGNDNVLPGDRLTITIPSESISAQPYDVIAVENLLNLDNWTTKPIMVNSANWRQQLDLRKQVDARRRMREFGMDEKIIP